MKQIFTLLILLAFTMALRAQQNVGIGTNTPHSSALLDMVSGSRGLLIPRMTSTRRTAISSPANGLLVYDSTTNSFWFYNSSVWNQIGTGGASPWTVSGNNIYNSNTGNVGIGTSTPTSKLHIVGNSILMNGTNPILQYQQSGVSTGFVQLSGDDIRMGTNSGNSAGKMIVRMNGTDRVFIDSIGQVGIGRTAPSFDLDIDGNARIYTTSLSGKSTLNLYANPLNTFDPYAPPGVLFSNYQDAGGGNYTYSTKFRIEMMGGITERLKLYHVDNDNQVVLRNNGNVGINTALPAEQLHITGNALLQTTKPMLILKTTSATILGQAGIRFSNASTNLANIIYTNQALYLSGSDTTVSGLPRPHVVIKDNGFVGLGTDNPLTKFHVVGGDVTVNSFNPSIQFQNAAVDKGFVQLSGDDIRIGTNSTNTTGKFIIRTNNNDQVYVDQNGNMGFGVSTPLSRIQILTGNDVSISSHGYLMLGSVTGANVIFDNNEIMARNNGTVSSLVLQNDGGSVRIGNVAVPAGYKFAVNGKVICEELKVKLSAGGWPDYVFEKGYHLPRLSEVEQFIGQHKHLPGIPSAADMEKNGIEVGDMQKRMMEKIEELTLYIIELKKEVDRLKNK